MLKMKKISAFFAMLFVVSLLTILVPGVLASNYMDVSVDGISEWRTPVSVVLGETVPIEVEYSVDADEEDVVVEAELAYGKGKKVEVSSEPLDAVEGTTYKVKLKLEISDKIDVTEPGETYYLSVTLRSGKGETLESDEFELTVQRENDLIEIQKIMVTPFAEAGKPTIVTVVVKNIGADEQEDLYLLLNVPELGVALEKRVGDLEEDEDVAIIDLPLRFPENTVEGKYNLEVKVYNDDVNVDATKAIFVSGEMKASDFTEVVPEKSSLDIKQGKTGTYELTLLNLGKSAKTYSISVSGLEGWASYEAEPASVKLNPSTSQVIELKLKVNENSLEGKHSFEVDVKSDGKTAREINLSANVKEKSTGVDAMVITVIVLAIVLAVLLVILVKSKKEGEAEESEESYY